MANINKLKGRPYSGAYSIQLVEGISTKFLSKIPVIVNGDEVKVSNGNIREGIGGIQFYVDDKPFSFTYDSMMTIKNSKGEILWENWNNKK